MNIESCGRGPLGAIEKAVISHDIEKKVYNQENEQEKKPITLMYKLQKPRTETSDETNHYHW